MHAVPKAGIASPSNWQGLSAVLQAPGQAEILPVPSRSFRPAYRLCKTDEYSSVFAFRKSIRGRYFVLHYRPGITTRIGIVVAKRFARRAVQRNLLKRLARETFRHFREILPDYDLVLRLNAPVETVLRAELRDEIAGLLRRLRK